MKMAILFTRFTSLLLLLLPTLPSTLTFGTFIRKSPIPDNASSDDIKRQALEVVVNHEDLPLGDLSALTRVNKELNRAISQTPKVKHLLSRLPNKFCTKNLVYLDHKRMPSREYPVIYLSSPPNSTDWSEEQEEEEENAYGLEHDAQCLEWLLAEKTPIRIATCAHEQFKALPQCSTFTEHYISWSVHVQGFLIRNDMLLNNVSYVKRRLLFAAIEFGYRELTSFLLEPQEATPIGTEHLAIALDTGGEEIFFHLVRRFEENRELSRQLLTFPFMRGQRDMADLVIGDGLFHHYLDPPSIKLLEWLFDRLPLAQRHFEQASEKSESETLHFLIAKGRRTLHEHRLNGFLTGSLKGAVISTNTANLVLLLDEITDFDVLDYGDRRTIITAAMTNKARFKEMLELLSHKLDVTIYVDHILRAIRAFVDVERVLWMMDQCHWALEDLDLLHRTSHRLMSYLGKDGIEQVQRAVRAKIYQVASEKLT